MRNFLAGLAVGGLVSLAATGYAASIVGGNGWLDWWTVTYNGEVVCEDPYVWASLKEIECG